jgi:hypothetical protein
VLSVSIQLSITRRTRSLVGAHSIYGATSCTSVAFGVTDGDGAQILSSDIGR